MEKIVENVLSRNVEGLFKNPTSGLMADDFQN